MINKIKEKITILWNSFLEWLTLTNILLLLLGILGIIGVLALFTFLCIKLSTFIIANKDLLLLCLTIIGCFAYVMYCRHENKKDAKVAQLRAEMTIAEEREKQTLEDAYRLLQELLYLAINETIVITKLPQLKAISALEAPTHWIQTNGFYCFQYLVAKDNATSTNIPQIKDVVNNRIRQALNAGEIIGSPQKMYFSDSGRPFQKILVHDIVNQGTYLQLNLVIVGEDYVKYIERARYVSSTPFDDSDIDF